jgi:hypothetical protein
MSHSDISNNYKDIQNMKPIKKKYQKPVIKKIILDKDISMVMMSPPVWEGSLGNFNPLKWIK